MKSLISWLCGYCHSRKPQAMLGVPRRLLRHCCAVFKNRGYAAILKSYQPYWWMLTLFSGTLLLLAGVFVTAVQPANPGAGASFAPLRAAVSRAAGWTERKEQYRCFTAKDLYGIIDGGAAEHEKQGLKSGIGLFFTSGNNSLDI